MKCYCSFSFSISIIIDKSFPFIHVVTGKGGGFGIPGSWARSWVKKTSWDSLKRKLEEEND